MLLFLHAIIPFLHTRIVIHFHIYLRSYSIVVNAVTIRILQH